MERLKPQQREGPRPPAPRAHIPKEAQGVPPMQPMPLLRRPVGPVSHEMGRGKHGKRPIIPRPTLVQPRHQAKGQRTSPPLHHHLHLHLLHIIRHHARSQSKKKKMNGCQLPKKSPWLRLQRLKPLMMLTTSVVLKKTRRNSKMRCSRRPSTMKKTSSFSIARRSRDCSNVAPISAPMSVFR